MSLGFRFRVSGFIGLGFMSLGFRFRVSGLIVLGFMGVGHISFRV